MIKPEHAADLISNQSKFKNSLLTKQKKMEFFKTEHFSTGRVFSLGDLIERESGFCKRELILKTDEYIPNLLSFEFHNGKMKFLDDLLVDQQVEVTFRIQGREWEGRVLNNLVGISLVKVSERALKSQEL